MYRKEDSRHYLLIACVLVAQLLIVVLNPSRVDGHLNPLFLETGPIETLSPLGYGLCMVLIVALGGIRFAFTRAFSLMVVLLAMLLRELDFHTRFTAMSVTKRDFFLSGEVALFEKLLAFFVLALIGVAVLHVIATYGRPFVERLRRFDPVGIAAALSMAMVVSSLVLDGGGRSLARIGFPVSAESGNFLEKVEETLEMGIPIFAALAILAYFSGRMKGVNREA